MPMMTRPAPASYTVDEVADLLRVVPETVRTWLRTGRIRGVKNPGVNRERSRWRIPHDELVRLQAGQ